VTEGGLSVGEASMRLSLPKSMLENWVRAFKAGKLWRIGESHRPLTDMEIELKQVKRELSMVRMERDILKKSGRVVCQGVAAWHAVMEQMRPDHPLGILCWIEATQPPAELLHHSDKGSQYCSLEYRRLLERLGMKASMSGTGTR